MNANATEAAIAVNIVRVKACANRGEKVLSAYMMWSPFVLVVVGDWLGWSALMFSLCSSVVNANEWGLASSRHEGSIYA